MKRQKRKYFDYALIPIVGIALIYAIAYKFQKISSESVQAKDPLQSFVVGN